VKQYVQHISGQGEKWEVSGRLYNEEQQEDWQVIPKGSRKDEWSHHYLPRSEYRLCEPPGPTWVPIDATYVNVEVLGRDGTPVFGQYRMMCSNVERKVTG
jgi:hypothetical protein